MSKQELPVVEKPSCSLCAYWERRIKIIQKGWSQKPDAVPQTDGHCFRFPPVYVGVNKAGDPCFGRPLLEGDEWCGEFKSV